MPFTCTSGMSGDATTTFIDSSPELFDFKPRKEHSTGILNYLGDVIVNGRPDVKDKVDPTRTLHPPIVPEYPRSAPPPGLRQRSVSRVETQRRPPQSTASPPSSRNSTASPAPQRRFRPCDQRPPVIAEQRALGLEQQPGVDALDAVVGIDTRLV